MIILSTFQGFERAYPLIIVFSLLMGYFIEHDSNYLLFAIVLGLSSFINQGFNLRPLEVSAAIGLNQFKRIDELKRVRKQNREMIIKSKIIS